jgi:hypothetical protein
MELKNEFFGDGVVDGVVKVLGVVLVTPWMLVVILAGRSLGRAA